MSTNYHRLALDTAELSPCNKRKVGAVLVQIGHNPKSVAGFNYNPNGACELPSGETHLDTIHAEIAVLTQYKELIGLPPTGATLYVTQPPCAKCQEALQDAGVAHIVVVEQFMKFDSAKLRYELIPTSATKALAKVLTYGARKYKADNWRKGEIDRYVGAAMRHFEAYRSGEMLDSESGLHHLEHLLTNVVFLLELEKSKKPGLLISDEQQASFDAVKSK